MRVAILVAVLVMAACGSDPTAPPTELNDTLTGLWQANVVARSVTDTLQFDTTFVELMLREAADGALVGCATVQSTAYTTSPADGVRTADDVTVTSDWWGFSFSGRKDRDELAGTAVSDRWHGSASVTFAPGDSVRAPCYY